MAFLALGSLSVPRSFTSPALRTTGTRTIFPSAATSTYRLGSGDQVLHQEIVAVVWVRRIIPPMDQLVEVHGAVCPIDLLLPGFGSRIRVELDAAVLDGGQLHDGVAALGRGAVGVSELAADTGSGLQADLGGLGAAGLRSTAAAKCSSGWTKKTRYVRSGSQPDIRKRLFSPSTRHP